MPLPFAPKPDESKVYQSLKSTLLNEVTPDQLETLRGMVFAQGVEGAEDEYRRLVLLMVAAQAGSVSGPIPGTGYIASVTTSSSGSGVVGLSVTTDEVWQLSGFSVSVSGITGSLSHEIYVRSDSGSITSQIVDYSSATGSQQPITEAGASLVPIWLDNGMDIVFETNGTFTTAIYRYVVQRVR